MKICSSPKIYSKMKNIGKIKSYQANVGIYINGTITCGVYANKAKIGILYDD
jgi:hypothetical protein